MGTLLQEALNARVLIREGDVVRKVSRAEAMVLALVSKAMKGEAKAFATLMALMQQQGEFEKEPIRLEAIQHIIVDPKEPSDSS
jgi:hypothetical protein